MSIFQITDDDGKVINTIVADLEVMKERYKDGSYTDVTPPPEPPPVPVDPLKEVKDAIAALSTKLDAQKLVIDKISTDTAKIK